jgi:hypothetical protein
VRIVTPEGFSKNREGGLPFVYDAGVQNGAPTARTALRSFIAAFSPQIARRTRAALATIRKRLPGAFELVYDNAYAVRHIRIEDERTLDKRGVRTISENRRPRRRA